MNIIAFIPDGKTPFRFQATVGGNKLFASVPYNQYSRRYYLKLTDSSWNTVSFTPLIASPDEYDINLAPGYPGGSLIFRESSNQFEVT